MTEQVTVIEYQYADTNNYKAHATLVLPGTLTPDEVVRMWAATFEGEQFLPAQVGLPTLQHLVLDGTDAEDHHIWHSITEITTEDAGQTSATVTAGEGVTAGDFAARFVGIDWDEVAADDALTELLYG
jgi:hypothetical protein